jgi:hypothetical protein
VKNPPEPYEVPDDPDPFGIYESDDDLTKNLNKYGPVVFTTVLFGCVLLLAITCTLLAVKNMMMEIL